MGWFSDKKVTSANLILQTSGSVSLKSYYRFRSNMFYGSDFSSEITAYELSKYKRNFKRNYNKVPLLAYGIQKNYMTMFGKFLGADVSAVLKEKSDELGETYTRVDIDETKVYSHPILVAYLPRDETYYGGLPSSMTTTQRNTLMVNELLNGFNDYVWKNQFQYVNEQSFYVYENTNLNDTSTQARRKYVYNISLSADRRVLSYIVIIQKQKANGATFFTDQWEIDGSIAGAGRRDDISAFTTHAFTSTYETIHADNLSNVTISEIALTEGLAPNALRAAPSYPAIPRECVYLLGLDVLSSELEEVDINRIVTLDPVASIKESNTNSYDSSVNYDDLTAEERLKQKGLEKMFRSLGQSTTAYNDTMNNPDIDDLSVGSFIDFKLCVNTPLLSRMGFDMFFESNANGKTSGRGNALSSNCSGGSRILLDIPLGKSSTLKIRANANQWRTTKVEFELNYPTEDSSYFKDGRLWKVSVSTSLTEEAASVSIIQNQYKTCLEELSNSAASAADKLKLFGNIEQRSNPDSQPVQDIIALVNVAKTNMSQQHTNGVYNEDEAHGSFSSLFESCQDHDTASPSRHMVDKLIVNVPENNPTNAQILKAVKLLGGKYEYFDRLSLKIKVSSLSLLNSAGYLYTSCRSRNANNSEDGDDSLVFTFARLNLATNEVDAVSIFNMNMEYQSPSLNWNFSQKYSKRDKMNFCIPIEFNSFFGSGLNFYEFKYVSSITNGTLLYVHNTVRIKWYQTEIWGMIFQLILVIIAVAVVVLSAGSGAGLSAYLVSAAEAVAYSLAIQYAVNIVVDVFGLDPAIGDIAKIAISLYMGDISGAMAAFKTVDAGLKAYTREVEDSLLRTIKDIDTIKKKSKELGKYKLLEESRSENGAVPYWAKALKAEMQSYLDIDSSLGQHLSVDDVEEREEMQRYEVEPINLSASVSIGGLFNSGSAIVNTRNFKHDEFLRNFPKH